MVLLSVMVQLHKPAQRVIDPYGYIWSMHLHNPYDIIISCQEDRAGFLRTSNMNCIHSHDPVNFNFFSPGQQGFINPDGLPGTAGQVQDMGFFYRIADEADLI